MHRGELYEGTRGGYARECGGSRWEDRSHDLHSGGAVALLALAASSCVQGMIRADAIAGLVEPVTDRHDAYVETDEGLADEQRRVYLRSSELLRAVVEEARK